VLTVEPQSREARLWLVIFISLLGVCKYGPSLDTWTLFCVISANSGSFRAHCVKVHVPDEFLILLANVNFAMLSPVRLSSVYLCQSSDCLSCVTFVRPT